MKSALIVGCGYLGTRVAAQWLAAGVHVFAVTRSNARAQALRAEGLEPIVADILQTETLSDLPTADATLFAVGWDRSAGDVITLYSDGLRNVLRALPAGNRRVAYVSSTGVYGPAGGDWVDELTAPNPQRDGGRASLAAEEILAQHGGGRRTAILRLAGIYGPGRVPYLAKLQAGESIQAPAEGWLNLIHVQDAAAVVVTVCEWLAATEASSQPHCFCVSDGVPVVRGDYYREVARQIGAPPPHFEAPAEDSPAAARARSDKRVSNRRLRETMDPEFRYPDYRQGLAAILG